MPKPDEDAADGKSPIPERTDGPLATYLEEVTIRMVSAVDSRSRERLREIANAYYAPNIELSHHILPDVGAVYASDRESYVDSIIAYANKFNFRIQPHNATATVDEEGGTAEVFVTVITYGTAGIRSLASSVTCTLTGSILLEASEAIGNESVLIYHFKRTSKQGEGGEKWTVWRVESMRGPGTGSEY